MKSETLKIRTCLHFILQHQKKKHTRRKETELELNDHERAKFSGPGPRNHVFATKQKLSQCPVLASVESNE